jgi:hypothetical protein
MKERFEEPHGLLSYSFDVYIDAAPKYRIWLVDINPIPEQAYWPDPISEDPDLAVAEYFKLFNNLETLYRIRDERDEEFREATQNDDCCDYQEPYPEFRTLDEMDQKMGAHPMHVHKVPVDFQDQKAMDEFLKLMAE